MSPKNLMRRLPRDFYEEADCAQVAQRLLGKFLVHERGNKKYVGRIVETEAYLGPHDLAAHSSKGVTARTQVMFGAAGHAYVYLIYGIHHCMNVVTGPLGSGSAVLIRAVEPIEGIELPTHGPGRLCKAMEIDRRHNGLDVCDGPLYIADAPEVAVASIVKTTRVGVDYAGVWAQKLLRFYEKDNAFVSKK